MSDRFVLRKTRSPRAGGQKIARGTEGLTQEKIDKASNNGYYIKVDEGGKVTNRQLKITGSYNQWKKAGNDNWVYVPDYRVAGKLPDVQAALRASLDDASFNEAMKNTYTKQNTSEGGIFYNSIKAEIDQVSQIKPTKDEETMDIFSFWLPIAESMTESRKSKRSGAASPKTKSATKGSRSNICLRYAQLAKDYVLDVEKYVPAADGTACGGIGAKTLQEGKIPQNRKRIGQLVATTYDKILVAARELASKDPKYQYLVDEASSGRSSSKPTLGARPTMSGPSIRKAPTRPGAGTVAPTRTRTTLPTTTSRIPRPGARPGAAVVPSGQPARTSPTRTPPQEQPARTSPTRTSPTRTPPQEQPARTSPTRTPPQEQPARTSPTRTPPTRTPPQEQPARTSPRRDTPAPFAGRGGLGARGRGGMRGARGGGLPTVARPTGQSTEEGIENVSTSSRDPSPQGVLRVSSPSGK